MFGSFFEQDHLLNLIILGVYVKRWPKCARISNQKLLQPKIWLMIFLTKDLSTGKILHEKNMGIRGKFLKKWKLCMQNLTKEQKQTLEVILKRVIFTIYLFCACAKNHENIHSRCLINEFPFTDIFLIILILVTG